jgi:hypothetical protein
MAEMACLSGGMEDRHGDRVTVGGRHGRNAEADRKACANARAARDRLADGGWKARRLRSHSGAR